MTAATVASEPDHLADMMAYIAAQPYPVVFNTPKEKLSSIALRTATHLQAWVAVVKSEVLRVEVFHVPVVAVFANMLTLAHELGMVAGDFRVYEAWIGKSSNAVSGTICWPVIEGSVTRFGDIAAVLASESEKYACNPEANEEKLRSITHALASETYQFAFQLGMTVRTFNDMLPHVALSPQPCSG